MIQVSIDSIISSHTGGTFGVDVTYENTTIGGVEYPECPNWVTYTEVGSAQYGNDCMVSYLFTVEANEGSLRDGRVKFEATDSTPDTWVAYLQVNQGSGEIVESPIWKDTFYTATNQSVFNYSITYEGVGIYYGKSYCAPGGPGALVQVNKVCNNFLRNNIGDLRELFDDVVENVGAYGDFSLCNEDGVEVCNYRFLMDYAGDWSGESPYVMTTVINGHIDPRMRALCTIYCDEETDIDYEIIDITE